MIIIISLTTQFVDMIMIMIMTSFAMCGCCDDCIGTRRKGEREREMSRR